MASSWARTRLEDDPEARLLVLIPDLRRREREILRSFSQALEPTTWTADAPARATRIGLEGGRALSEFPLVQSRLALLRRPRGVVPARAFLRWLRSVCADPATSESLRASRSLAARRDRCRRLRSRAHTRPAARTGGAARRCGVDPGAAFAASRPALGVRAAAERVGRIFPRAVGTHRAAVAIALVERGSSRSRSGSMPCSTSSSAPYRSRVCLMAMQPQRFCSPPSGARGSSPRAAMRR